MATKAARSGLALLQVAPVGALEVLHDILHVARPHRRLGEEEDVLGAELHALVCRVQELVALEPLVPLQRRAGGVERILDDLAHGLTVASMLEVCHAGRP